MTYFSLVTLATVGYGDILPRSDTARMVAMIEAVVGQFYVAVIVAIFVGMYRRPAPRLIALRSSPAATGGASRRGPYGHPQPEKPALAQFAQDRIRIPAAVRGAR